MLNKVAIIDYGSGNIISAKQSFIKVSEENNLKLNVVITNNLEEIKNSSHIVLPGQGAFKSCMEGLEKIDGMIHVLETCVLKNKIPFLGICVGMQLLADESYENGTHKGLGWINGKIKKLNIKNLKIPHVGWNNVRIVKKNSQFKSLKQNEDFYFVHSYHFDCLHSSNIIGETSYGIKFVSMVGKDNIFGVQFHPEKSSEQGLGFLKEFLLI